MREILLRWMVVSLIVMIGVSAIALVVGRFSPADMLSITMQTVVLRGNRYSPELDRFLLIDLNRHLRVSVPIPVEGIIETTIMHWTGQEALIIASGSPRRVYLYNLIEDTLSELNITHINPETSETFEIDSFSRSGNDIWDYDPLTGAVYRLDVTTNSIGHVITLLDENDADYQPLEENRFPTFSPDGTQVAYVDHQGIFMFNVDGSDLRRYDNPLDRSSTYGYWSQDGWYFYVNGISAFGVMDLSSGEIMPSTQNLEGKSFAPCWLHNQWLAYVDAENQAHVLNYETGAAQNLSLIPELMGKDVDMMTWMTNCEWLMVTMRVQSSNNLIGLQHQQIYLVSRDGQTVYLLGDDVATLGWIDDQRFLLAESQGVSDIIYEVRFDGSTVQRTPIGSFTPDGSWLTPLRGNPYRLFVYANQLNQISVLDVRSGAVETYFAPNELITTFPVQWFWE